MTVDTSFFDALYPDWDDPLRQTIIEVRRLNCFDDPNHVHQNWFGSKDKAMQYALDTYGSSDVYFGVAPRVRASGKAEDVALPTSLWADFDTKGRSRSDVFNMLTRLSPAPQIIVDSGNGYHCYWLLRHGEIGWDGAIDIMQAIAMQYGGDRTYDRARILRVPGTLNHKSKPPKPVRLLRLDLVSPRYGLSDFADLLDPWRNEVFTPRRAYPGAPVRVPVRGDTGIPSWLVALIEQDPGKGQRSGHVFHVVASLVELGYPDDEIENVMRENPDGVGAKYAEKGNRAHDYLKYPIAEARRRVGSL